MGSVSEYRLTNGLQILLIPDPNKSFIQTNIIYRVGSRHEKHGETGIAHLLEHMLYRPSLHFQGKNSPKTPVELLANLGAKFEGTTELDSTSYKTRFIADNQKLKQVLELEAFRMLHAKFDEDALWNKQKNTGEKTVVRNELEMKENDPNILLRIRLHQSAYDAHPYRHLPIGNHVDIQAIKIDQLNTFYKTYYRPDNATIVINGKFELSKALRLIDTYFGGMQKPKRQLPEIQIEEAPQTGSRTVDILRKAGSNFLGVAYHYPSIAHQDHLALLVLEKILTQDRIQYFAIEKQLTSVTNYQLENTITKDASLKVFRLQLPQKIKLEEIQAGFVMVLENFKKKPIAKDEFDARKKQLINEFEEILTDSEKLAERLAAYSAVTDWRLFYLQRETLKSITRSDVQIAAEKYHQASNRTIARIIKNESAPIVRIPASPDLSLQLSKIRDEKKVTHQEPRFENFTDLDKNIERLNLRNGVQVALLPMKNQDHSLSVAFRLNFGSEKSLTGYRGHAPCANCYRADFKDYETKNYKEKLPGYSFSINASDTHFIFSMSSQGRVEDITQFLELFSAYVKAPKINAFQIEQNKKTMQAHFEQQKTNPQALALNAAERLFDPTSRDHIKHALSFPELIGNLQVSTEKNALAFHQKFFGPQNANVVVVGEFDPVKMKQQLQLFFENWKSAVPYQRIPYQIKPAQAVDQTIQISQSSNSYLLAYYPIPINDESPDYPSLLLANWIFGEAELQNRLMSRIRQVEGLSYSVGSELAATSIDKASRWLIYANCAPANLPRVKMMIQEEIEKAVQNGFSQTELNNAKISWLENRKMHRLSLKELPEKLLDYQSINRTFDYDISLEAKIASLTLKELNSTMKKYIDPARIAYFRVGNFNQTNR